MAQADLNLDDDDEVANAPTILHEFKEEFSADGGVCPNFYIEASRLE